MTDFDIAVKQLRRIILFGDRTVGAYT